MEEAEFKFLKTRQQLVDFFENLPRMLYVKLGNNKMLTLHSYKFARLILFSMGQEMHRDGKLDLLSITKLTRMYSDDFLSEREKGGYQMSDNEIDFAEELVSLFSLEILKARVSDHKTEIILCNEQYLEVLFQ
jgi:hypothetical protein